MAGKLNFVEKPNIFKLVILIALTTVTVTVATHTNKIEQHQQKQKPQLTQVEYDPRCPLQFTHDKAIIYPHEYDCKRYYLCAENGTLIEIECSNGLEFDNNLYICNWPKGDCNGSNQAITIGARMHSFGEQTSQICKSEEDGLLFPNYDDNCQSFFKCYAGKAYQISCGNGLLFNEKTNYCDWNYNVVCGKPLNNTTNGYYRLPNCVSQADGTLYANYQNNCKSFYMCHHGSYIQSNCQGKLVFNERIGACDWPENVQCLCKNQCIGGPAPESQIQQSVEATQRPSVTSSAHRPSNSNDSNCKNVAVKLCPPQPCPPENCVLQACIPNK